MPGINEPMAATLFGATDEAPQWDRIDNSEKLLQQLLTIAAPAHAAAPLTMLGHICWWKGRGTAAANYMHVALTFDPDYHLARLLDQMLGAGVVSGWAQHKNTAYGPTTSNSMQSSPEESESEVRAMNVTVYSKPGCQQCKFTCLSLDHAGIPFRVVDLTTNAAALEYVQDLGYSKAPVVVVSDHHHWSGFNPTEIERLRLAIQ